MVPATRIPSKWTPAKLAILIFLLGFLVRVAGVIATHQYRDLERYELERVAISLATTGVFGNPYAIPTGPTAHVSPGYPLILALIFRLFGTGVPAEVVKQGLACAISAGSAALLVPVAVRLGLGIVPGAAAGLYSSLLPLKFQTETIGDWETALVAPILMLVAVLTADVWRRQTFLPREALRAGLAWGIGLLFVSALLFLFLGLLLVGLVFARREPLLRYAQFAVIEVAVVALCLAPWVIRNEWALGAPIVTRSNTGLELRISNNDLADAQEQANFFHGLYRRYHPLQSRAEALKVRELGEVRYNQLARQEAREWITSHPARFAQLTLGRVRWFWFYTNQQRAKSVLLYLTRLLGFAGLVIVFRRDRITGTVLAAILLIFPLPNYLVHVGLRHSYPIDWITTLLMLVTFCAVWRRFATNE